MFKPLTWTFFFVLHSIPSNFLSSGCNRALTYIILYGRFENEKCVVMKMFESL